MSWTKYHLQVSVALKSLQIHRSDGYSWCGAAHHILPRKLRTVLTEEDVRACMVSAIENRLYRNFYCTGTTKAEAENLYGPSSQAITMPFVQMLSDANHGTDHFDPGWCVLSTSPKSAVVIKDGLRLTADSSELRSDQPIIQGVTVSLRTAKECFGMTPGFYLAIGSAPGTVKDSADTLVRLYWNITAAGALLLVSKLTEVLNSKNIRFRLKALSDPSTYQRCDAVVLYSSKADLVGTWDEVAQIYESVRAHLKADVPALTKELAPGLGLAEDPRKATSFGMHRCNLIAEAVVNGTASVIRRKTPSLDLVAERFAKEGLELDRPYLNKGSGDDYTGLIIEPRPQTRAGAPASASSCNLEAAVAIGKALSRSAIYAGNACTWAGYYSTHEFSDRTKPNVWGTTGPSLYSGSAGIGWFLSELYAATHDDEIGECAMAALRGAVLAAEPLPGSLFTGWAGISLAAAYGSKNLGCPELRNAAAELLNLLDRAHDLPSETDLLTGRAGLVTALVLEAKLLDNQALIKEALIVGEGLLEAAQVRANVPGCSWPTSKRQAHPNLAGLSHGVSGIALALSHLFAATGRPEIRDCAHQGIRYEEALFDAKVNNWPDLRTVRNRRRAVGRSRFSWFWCHGAPGIGVARAAACRYLNSDDYRSAACTAFASTHTWTSCAFAEEQQTGCLCHGLAGNALILWHARAETSAQEAAAYGALAKSIGSRLAHRVLEGKPAFAEGTEDIDNPGLMTGFAGLGHYLLQLAEVPSLQFLSPVWLI